MVPFGVQRKQAGRCLLWDVCPGGAGSCLGWEGIPSPHSSFLLQVSPCTNHRTAQGTRKQAEELNYSGVAKQRGQQSQLAKDATGGISSTARSAAASSEQSGFFFRRLVSSPHCRQAAHLTQGCSLGHQHLKCPEPDFLPRDALGASPLLPPGLPGSARGTPTPPAPGLTEEGWQVCHGLQEGLGLDLLVGRQHLELMLQQQRHDRPGRDCPAEQGRAPGEEAEEEAGSGRELLQP